MASCQHISNVTQLLDHPLRDTWICVAPDGYYYLTGTTGAPDWWSRNNGIELWRSKDMRDWEHLGLVWSIEDGTWQKEPAGPQQQRTVWAPELHHINGNYWLTYCLPGHGSSLLRSTTGRAEGPYEDVCPDGPLVDGYIDGSLFQDDDGSVWYVCAGGMVARMTDDMTALASDLVHIVPDSYAHVGFEGAFLTKVDGRYHIFTAEFVDPATDTCVDMHPELDWSALRYSCMSASAPTLTGPWSERYLVSEHAGHNMIFQDRDGSWKSTYFGNHTDPCAPFRERPGVFDIELGPDARWREAVRG